MEMLEGRITLLAALILAFFVAISLAAAGNASRGKALFRDPAFAGATSGRSCNTCHPEGKGLEHAGSKREFHIAGQTQKSLEEAVNACIEYAIGGKALEVGSKDMQDIISYIKSLERRN